MGIINKFVGNFIYFNIIIWFSKQKCRSWVEAMRLLIMALVFSSMISSCADAWPILPPASLQHCFSNDMSVSSWSVHAFRRNYLPEDISANSPVRGCVRRDALANLNHMLHIFDMNYTSHEENDLKVESYVTIYLTVLANDYDGEVAIMLNLRTALVRATLHVDFRNLNLLRKHKLLVSNNLVLHLNNPELLRNKIVKVECFAPDFPPEQQDMASLEKWAAKSYQTPSAAASYTLLSVKGSIMPNYFLLNVSHAPVLAKRMDGRNSSRASDSCVPTRDLEPPPSLSQSSDTVVVARLLKVMIDVSHDVNDRLCRQRNWSLEDSISAASQMVSNVVVKGSHRDFVFLDANLGPLLLYVQLETSALIQPNEREAPLLGLSVAKPILNPLSVKLYNMTLVLLTDMLTRAIEIETNADSLLFLGKNRHLVNLSQSSQLNQLQFSTLLLKKYGAYRELVRINVGEHTNHDSNFARVLLGERAVTTADLAQRTFIRCTPATILIKVPLNALSNLGLDPHRDIWLGGADATHDTSSTLSSSRCYFRVSGPDLYRILEYSGGACGSYSKLSKSSQSEAVVLISVAVGSDQIYTYQMTCTSEYMNLEVVNALPLESYLRQEKRFPTLDAEQYKYDIMLYSNNRYRYNFPVLDTKDYHYLVVSPVGKDVQHGVELIDCFISKDRSPPEQSGNPPIFHLVQGGCSHPWAGVKWYERDTFDQAGFIPFNRTFQFHLASVCRSEAMASILSVDTAAGHNQQLFYLHCRLRPCSFQGIDYAASDPLSRLPFCYASQREVCSASFLAPPSVSLYVKTAPFQLHSRQAFIEGSTFTDFDEVVSKKEKSSAMTLPLWSVFVIASLAFVLGAFLVLALWCIHRSSSSQRSLLCATTDASSHLTAAAYLGIHIAPQSSSSSTSSTFAQTSALSAALRRPYTCSECSSNCSHNSSSLTGPLLPPMAAAPDSSTTRVTVGDSGAAPSSYIF